MEINIQFFQVNNIMVWTFYTLKTAFIIYTRVSPSLICMNFSHSKLGKLTFRKPFACKKHWHSFK